MANASLDNNNIPTILATLDSDGETPVAVKVVPTGNHGLKVDDDTTGSDMGPTDARRDDNNVPVMIAVSSSDGTTPVALYADSDGNLLIDSA